MPFGTIANTEDVMDSRDVIERIEELEAQERELQEAQESGADFDAWDIMDDDAVEELRVLRALAAEAEGYAPDWLHGETLIRDSYFVEYAQQFAEDIGAISASASWPNSCIDWDQAARELRMDYTSVDFDGVTYWIR